MRSDLADEQNRRETIAARAEKVTSALQTGGRLNPEDTDDHDDVGHHYAATLKPSLAELDPAQKPAAIGGYVADTGIAPDAALKTLLGLTATGDASNRIAATRELVAVFDTDPTARNRVPPGLAAYAETLVDLADTYELAPDEAIKTADAFFSDNAPGADRPNPALLQLVSAKNTGVQIDAQPDAQADTTRENDTAPTDVTEDAESDEDDVFFDGETDDPLDRALEEDQADGLGPDFFGPVGSRPGEFEVAMAGGGRGLLTRAGTFDREELDRFDEFTRRLSLGERSRNLTTGLIRDAADKNASTQQALRAAASEEELALGELLLSLVPGLGTVMNGTKAIEAFREALELERAGKLDQAMKKRREAALDAVAALGPLALIAKADKIAKAFRYLVSRAKRNRDAARRAEGDNGQAIAKAATAAAQGQRLLSDERDTFTPKSKVSD